MCLKGVRSSRMLHLAMAAGRDGAMGKCWLMCLACVAAYSARAVQHSWPIIQRPGLCCHASRGHKGVPAILSSHETLPSPPGCNDQADMLGTSLLGEI